MNSFSVLAVLMFSPPLLRRLLLTLLLLPLLTGGEPDLNSDRAALLAFKSAVGSTVLQWNATNSPCSWKGVGCIHNRVVILRLPAVRLIGEIPIGTIGKLTALRILSLRFNGLSGSLPPDLVGVAQLRKLYLQNNRFSGEIPPVLFSLQKLILLNLAGNGFTGDVSIEFNNLSRLKTLHLERNQLSGGIPELNLPKLVHFNVSFNRLNGSVPLNLWKIPASAFMGTSLCGGPLPTCPGKISKVPAAAFAKGGGGSKLSGIVIAGFVAGSLSLMLMLLIVLLFMKCRCSGWGKDRTHDVETGEAREVARGREIGEAATPEVEMRIVHFGNVGAPQFNFDDLLRAWAEVLGKGTFGMTYKAMVGTVVVIKRLKNVILTEEEFKEKVDAMGCMNHENIVPLRAYYYSENVKLLLYDYMTLGSLSALLHGSKRSGRTYLINWEERIYIALSVARGVEHIHSTSPTASHGNIKSTNIFLNASHNVCVSENGLADLVVPSSSPNPLSGYRAPEVAGLGKVSQKADIYSFGVLLLELLTGRDPDEGVDLPRLVQAALQQEWPTDVLDLELLREPNVAEMVQLMQLAISCTVQNPDSRPLMPEVMAQIEVIRDESR